MLLADAPLSFHEFAMREPLPLGEIFAEVFRYLQGRRDVALFGAHAVNSYCANERMTQDVDVLALHAAEFAENLRNHLSSLFHIAVRTPVVARGLGFRIYQVRDPKNRHLVDVRQVGELPGTEIVDDVLVVKPEVLVAMKVISWIHRGDQPKGDTDAADLKRLLIAFPQLKVDPGDVGLELERLAAPREALTRWSTLVGMHFRDDDEEGY